MLSPLYNSFIRIIFKVNSVLEPDISSRQRRFGGLERLYGPQSTAYFADKHVMVAGIGGVGSWCVEALARTGLGRLTLIDLDHVAESNVNRQLPALSSTLGKAKCVAMAERIADINPECKVDIIDDFIGPDNVASCLASKPDVLIDCTDQVLAKIAMIVHAKSLTIKTIVCGAAGGKTDALALRHGDLSLSTNDALLARLRQQLRKHHGYARPSVKGKKRRVPKMGVSCLWVDQVALLPAEWSSPAEELLTAPQGLSCAGYGSAVTVTAPMGFAAAQLAITHLLSLR